MADQQRVREADSRDSVFFPPHNVCFFSQQYFQVKWSVNDTATYTFILFTDFSPAFNSINPFIRYYTFGHAH